MAEGKENIIYLIYPNNPVEEKEERYKSIHSERVAASLKTNLRCHQTMGLPEDFLKPNPHKYLKKYTGPQKIPLHFRKCKIDISKREPMFPKISAQTKTPKKRNIILANIISAIKSRPKDIGQKVYDPELDRKVHDCGRFIHKPWPKGFGKVPKYIRDIKKAVDAESAAKAEEQPPRCVLEMISDEEKAQVIEDLRKKALNLNTEYSLLPLVCDNISQFTRKLDMEHEMDDLAKELRVLEENTIFIEKIMDPA